jgi:hypothetical protein
MNTIKMAVAGYNANGEPDFFFVKVECTEEQRGDGAHYHAAYQEAFENGYEGPYVAFDEDDPGFRALKDAFVWESATVIKV